MKSYVLIGLGAVLLAACAPTTTSGMSSTTAATSGAPLSPTSTIAAQTADTSTQGTSDDSQASGGTSATSTTAVSVATPTVATSAPVNNGTGFQSGTFPMTRQATAPSALNPTGTLTIQANDGQVQTSASLSGLAPNTYYVAHYHLQGTKSADPCTSGGQAIVASKIVAQSDGTGALNLTGTTDANTIKGATYFNVHTASDASGTPADDGVICTPVH